LETKSAIALTTQPTVKLGAAISLFELGDANDRERASRPDGRAGFAVSKDGSRFLLSRTIDSAAARRASITQNWAAALGPPR